MKSTVLQGEEREALINITTHAGEAILEIVGVAVAGSVKSTKDKSIAVLAILASLTSAFSMSAALLGESPNGKGTKPADNLNPSSMLLAGLLLSKMSIDDGETQKLQYSPELLLECLDNLKSLGYPIDGKIDPTLVSALEEYRSANYSDGKDYRSVSNAIFELAGQEVN